MKTNKPYAAFFLFFFLFLIPSCLLAYDNSKEIITEFVPDTGDMNERESDRKFAGSFKIETKSTNADDYIYNDIKNIPIGNEIYIKVTFYEKENLDIKFKLSDENFYDDYEDMNKLSPKNTDVENNLNVQYYNIKKVNNSNFLLLVIPGFKNIKYNIYQTIEDEYQQKMKKIEEAEKAKKRTIIISVTVPIGALIIIIIIIIIVKKRKLKKIEFYEEKQEYPEKSYADDDNLSAAMLPTYPTSY